MGNAADVPAKRPTSNCRLCGAASRAGGRGHDVDVPDALIDRMGILSGTGMQSDLDLLQHGG